jgi:hypothetical protein
MRLALLYFAAIAATASIIRAEVWWLDDHIAEAGRVVGIIVLAVLE